MSETAGPLLQNRAPSRTTLRCLHRAAAISLLALPITGCLPNGPSPEDEPTTENSTRVTRSAESRPTTAPAPRVPEETDAVAAPEIPAPEAPPAAPQDLPATPEPVVEEEPIGGVEEFLGTNYEDARFVQYLQENSCYWTGNNRLICEATSVEFAASDGVVSAVFLHPGYQGATPGGVAFGDTPEDVVTNIGEPDSMSSETSWTYMTDAGTRVIIDFPADYLGGYSGTPQPLVVSGISYQLA